MNEAYWQLLDKEIDVIKTLRGEHSGAAVFVGKNYRAELDCGIDNPTFKISHILALDLEDCVFDLQTEHYQLRVTGVVTGEQNTLNQTEGWSRRYSTGKIDQFQSVKWQENRMALYRTYYHLNSNRFLYDFFGFKETLDFGVNAVSYRLTSHDNFLVVESTEPVDYETYTEQVYNLMLAIGFVTGRFIQDHNYTFQQEGPELTFLYRRLRPGSNSIYHALTWNAYGYKDMLGRDQAKAIAQSEILKPFDAQSLGRLAALSNDHHAIQYALVLFNEANSNILSLLVKNSCFYTVLEIFRKFFHRAFEASMPKGYSNLGNIPKFKVVFGQLAAVTVTDETMLKKRNAVLHGEIDDLEGTEMIDLMQMQISLIYKLLLTYIGFDGYIIDHYALRNEQPDLAFLKLN